MEGGQSERNRLFIDLAVGEKQQAFDDVAQFANIAGPRVFLQRFDRGSGEGNRLPSVLRAHLAGEMLDERRQVFAAAAQGRQLHREHHHAMVEVAAERAGLDQLFEIAMGGDHDAHIHGGGLVGADALHLAFFEHAQQLGLHGGGHVADFVEEQRAAMGLLEFAGVALGGAGERALLVAEEFAFDQLGGNGGAVQRDERAAGAMALFMQGARHQFLAGAGFAIDADAGFAGGDALDLRHDAAHGFAGPHQGVLADARAQVAVLDFEARELSAFSSVTRSFSVESGFSRKSSAPSRVARTAISMCAWPLIITTGAVTPAAFRSSSSARPSRRGITTSLRIRSKGCAWASSSARAALSQTTASWPARRKARESEASVLASSSTIRILAFAVMHSALGRVMMKVAPSPARLSTAILPLWSAITDCTMASPRPVPCCLVV